MTMTLSWPQWHVAVRSIPSSLQHWQGSTGVPILDTALAAVECKVTSIVEQGDHHIVVGEVVDAHVAKPITGRPDAAILEMKELGDNVFYGG